MDQAPPIDGALARFSAARRAAEDAEEDLDARRRYTVQRVLEHTDAVMLINDLTDAAAVLEECMDTCPDAIRARHSSLALKDWCRWIKEPANR